MHNDTFKPTVGFEPHQIQFRYTRLFDQKTVRYQLTLWDLGGGPRIRGIWKHYLSEAHGVIYVVENRKDTFDESMAELRKLIESAELRPRLQDKPILILLNDVCSNSNKPESAEITLSELEEEVSKFTKPYFQVESPIILTRTPGQGRKIQMRPEPESNQSTEQPQILFQKIQLQGRFPRNLDFMLLPGTVGNKGNRRRSLSRKANQVAPLTSDKSAGLDPMIPRAFSRFIDSVEIRRDKIEAVIAAQQEAIGRKPTKSTTAVQLPAVRSSAPMDTDEIN